MPKAINLKSFKSRAYKKRKALKVFLDKIHNDPPVGLDKVAKQKDAEVWEGLDCLACANCCKTMTPTYTKADVRRISQHLNMTTTAMFDKWLTTDTDNGDIVNKSTPCQFLKKDNKCSIYEVRPADCAGFPHFKKKNIQDYAHVYADNLHRCPATLLWTEKMEKHFESVVK